MDARLAGQLDREEIRDLLFAYAAALDDRDWPRLAHCFVAAGEARWGAPGALQTGVPAILAQCQGLIARLDATHHMVSNVQVEVSGDRARARSGFQAQHLRGGARFALGGEYRDLLTRTLDGWRIHTREIHILWQDGDPAVLHAPPPTA